VSQLGRVLDPSALDRSTGPKGRLEITLPARWIEEGAEIEIVAPKLVTCARCDGGGCESCRRSGAIRLAADPIARTVTTVLPQRDAASFALRLLHPFGPSAPLEQLIVEVRVGEAPSAGVSRLDAPRERAATDRAEPGAGVDPWLGFFGFALTVAAVVAAALAMTSH
jgi:hypothetical protein